MMRLPRRLPPLPKVVWLLGLTSLLTDASSEIAHAVLPLLLVGPLAASNLTIGLIDGAVEAVASVTKIYSGALSDRSGARKRLATLGYGISAFAKFLFPLASTPAWIFFGRFADRLGKGIRGAPRDALIVDWTPPERLGYAFGVRQGLDNIGAVIGPCLAMLLLGLYDGDFQAALWWAIVPGLASAALIGFAVDDAPRHLASAGPSVAMPSHRMAQRLGSRFWLAMGLLTPLLAARCSEAFLILRAAGLGVPLQWAPLALVVMNAIAAPVTPVAGHLSDKFGRHRMIFLGFAMLMASHAILAFARTPADVWIAAALWGVHLGFTQGAFSALVADRAPPDLRGTAFGVYHLSSGMAILLGSALMGWGWDRLGPATSHAIAGASIVIFLPLFIVAARR